MIKNQTSSEETFYVLVDGRLEDSFSSLDEAEHYVEQAIEDGSYLEDIMVIKGSTLNVRNSIIVE